MQLGTWTIPLLPAVAVGVAVVLAVLVGWGVSRARRRSAATVPPLGGTAEDVPDTDPRPEDWTGEAAGGAADPLPPRRTTVADAVAARGADTPAYGVFPTGQQPSEPGYADPLPAHRETVRAGAGPAADGASAAAASPDTGVAVPTARLAAPERVAAPTGSATDTTALPTVDAAGSRSADPTAPADGAVTTASTAAATTALPLVHPAGTSAPSAGAPATAGADPTAVEAGGAGSAEATTADATAPGATPAEPATTTATDPATTNAAGATATGTDAAETAPAGTAPAGTTPAGTTPAGTTAAGTAAAEATATGATAAGATAAGAVAAGAVAPTGTARPRTGPRHAYIPAPTPPAPARTAYDPWALEPDPGPDPWATPAAPDPTVALASPDATAQLAAYEPGTGHAPGTPAGPRTPEAADPTGSRPEAAAGDVPPRSEAGTGDETPPAVAGSGPAGDVTGAGPDRESPDSATPGDADDAVDSGPVPPPWSAARSDPDAARSAAAAAPISVAVAQALAAREIHRNREGREDGPEPDVDPVPGTDARDRLLSVLLTDPAAALGAATELDDTRARIDQLGDVLRRRRADLAAAVQRLHASGLTEPQIGRLSGLGDDDVRAILERRTEEDAAER